MILEIVSLCVMVIAIIVCLVGSIEYKKASKDYERQTKEMEVILKLLINYKILITDKEIVLGEPLKSEPFTFTAVLKSKAKEE